MNLSSEEEFLAKKFEGYKNKAISSYKMTLTKFLSLREQEILTYIVGKNNEIFLKFSNISGYDEYKRAIISPFLVEDDFDIDIIKVSYNKKFGELNHRQILGTIMSLQIERNMIGDILINKDKEIYIISSSEMSKFIIDNVFKVNNSEVILTKTDKVIGDFSPDYIIRKYFLASLRIDLVASEGFGLSRNKVQEMIKAGLLKLNTKEEKNVSKQLEASDMISLKGYGRIKLLNIGGLSKSGKICVEIGKLK